MDEIEMVVKRILQSEEGADAILKNKKLMNALHGITPFQVVLDEYAFYQTPEDSCQLFFDMIATPPIKGSWYPKRLFIDHFKPDRNASHPRTGTVPDQIIIRSLHLFDFLPQEVKFLDVKRVSDKQRTLAINLPKVLFYQSLMLKQETRFLDNVRRYKLYLESNGDIADCDLILGPDQDNLDQYEGYLRFLNYMVKAPIDHIQLLIEELR